MLGDEVFFGLLDCRLFADSCFQYMSASCLTFYFEFQNHMYHMVYTPGRIDHDGTSIAFISYHECVMDHESCSMHHAHIYRYSILSISSVCISIWLPRILVSRSEPELMSLPELPSV